jgi:hypothetical protein
MAAMSVYIKREGRLMESEQVVKFRDRIAALEAENAMSDTEAVDQLNEEIWNLAILGDPQAADALVRLVAGSRAIATACELENAALWGFVRAADECECQTCAESAHPLLSELEAARDALRQYEEKPCGTCGSVTHNHDCWRCVGADDPRS